MGGLLSKSVEGAQKEAEKAAAALKLAQDANAAARANLAAIEKEVKEKAAQVSSVSTTINGSAPTKNNSVQGPSVNGQTSSAAPGGMGGGRRKRRSIKTKRRHSKKSKKSNK